MSLDDNENCMLSATSLIYFPDRITRCSYAVNNFEEEKFMICVISHNGGKRPSVISRSTKKLRLSTNLFGIKHNFSNHLLCTVVVIRLCTIMQFIIDDVLLVGLHTI